MKNRLVYLCDWLPPDFGAVGQYALLAAQDLAKEGWAVTLVGLTSESSAQSGEETIGKDTLTTIRVYRPKYAKERFARRVIWTLISNLLLIKAALAAMQQLDLSALLADGGQKPDNGRGTGHGGAGDAAQQP